jgi:DnaJ-domain-containing protein 1
MAKAKKPAGTQSRRAAIEHELRSARYAEAWRAARQLWADEPTDANLQLMQSVAQRVCQAFIDANNPGEFAKYIQAAAALPAGMNAEWPITLAMLQAKAGYLTAARKILEPLNNPKAMSQALAFAADKSILARQAELMPPEHHATYKAVLAAFNHYHTGNDDAARESLNAVGLQSPYLDWKVFLRGLIAFTAKDDARAIENLQRLNAERLPARLALPFRAKIDPAFRTQLPPETAAAVERSYQAITQSTLAEKIRTIRKQCQPGKSLSAAFATAQSALPLIRSQSPGLERKLANCMYHVLQGMGMPDDLKHYLKAFGPPAHDPEFHLLQGCNYDNADNPQAAYTHFEKYAKWLRTSPPAWSADVVLRARAKIALRAAKLAGELAEAAKDDDAKADLLDMFAPGKKKGAKKSKPKEPVDPEPMLIEAVACAPDWDAPTLALMEHYRDANDDKMAEVVATEFLKHVPDSLPVLKKLAEIVAWQKRPERHCELRAKIHSLNPLDPEATQIAIHTYATLARFHAAKKNSGACESALAEATRLNDGHDHYSVLAVRSALVMLRGEDGDAIEKQILEKATHAAVMRYLRLVHATIMKFKPAVKKAAAAQFAEALSAISSPIGLAGLWMEVERIAMEGWKFTGEATLRKKVLAAILASPKAGQDPTFEAIASLLEQSAEWTTLQKFTAKMGKVSPQNPYFPYAEACACVHLKPAGMYETKIFRLATKAERILERDPSSRHAHLLPAIRRLLDEYGPDFSFFDAFDSFFGRR